MYINEYVPTLKQQIAHKADAIYKLYGGAVGGGKSVWLCVEAIMLSLSYPGNRIMMCRKQLTDFKMSTLVTLLKLIPPGMIIKDGHNRSEHTIKFTNGSMIIYKGLGNEVEVDSIRSLEVSAIMMDEATELSHEAFLMCAQRIGRWRLPSGKYPPKYVLLASNPDTGWCKNNFIDQKKEGYAFIQALPQDNPHLEADYIPRLRRDYPPFWVKRFLDGDWNASMADDNVIPYEHILDAIDKEIEVVNKPIVSCDPARGGDNTVIMFGMGNNLLKIDAKKERDTMVSAARFLRMYHDNKARRGIIEVDGLGGPVYDRCRNMGLKVSPFRSGDNAFNKDKYFKLKTEAWFHVRDQFENGLVSIPNDPELINELAAIKYNTRPGGQLWVEQKKDFKKRMGKSSDRADALMLLLWGVKNMKDPVRGHNRMLRNTPISVSGNTSNGYGWSYASQ